MQYHPTHDEIRLLDDALGIDDPFDRGNAVKAWFYDPTTGAIRITPRTIGTDLDYLAILVHYAMEGGADLNAEARLGKVDARLEYYRGRTESIVALEGRDRVAGAEDDVGSPIGAYFLGSVDPKFMSRVMAGIVLTFVLVLLTGWRYEGEKRLLPTLGIGAASGTLMAATSMGNPPVLLYMLSSRDSATTNRANIIGYFAVTQIVLLFVLMVMDLLTGPPVFRAALLAPPYLLPWHYPHPV